MAAPNSRVPDTSAREAMGAGERYRPQLQQLNTMIGGHDRARAVADWALAFFDRDPEIGPVAKAVSREVDDALLAVSPVVKPKDWAKSLPWPLDITSALDWWRKPLDEATKLYTEQSATPWMLTYRIPRAAAIGIWAVEDLRGRCEEHTFLALYLLTLGHMIQNMRFGRLHNDIYYAGMAVKGHGFAVVVKGAEMKDALLAAPKGNELAQRQWLAKNLDQWGTNAWIVDGYEEARLLAQERRVVDLELCEDFRRDPTQEASEWDLTLAAMVSRIASDYDLDQ